MHQTVVILGVIVINCASRQVQYYSVFLYENVSEKEGKNVYKKLNWLIS